MEKKNVVKKAKEMTKKAKEVTKKIINEVAKEVEFQPQEIRIELKNIKRFGLNQDGTYKLILRDGTVLIGAKREKDYFIITVNTEAVKEDLLKKIK